MESNKIPMTCPICYKTKNHLDKHLRRRCMVDRSEEEIMATLNEAKNNLANVATNGLAIEYTQLKELVCDGQCLDNVTDFLKGRGFIIYNCPLLTCNSQKNSQRKKRRVDKKDSQTRIPENIQCTNTDMGEKSVMNTGCQHRSSQPSNKAMKKDEEGVIMTGNSETKGKKTEETTDKTVTIEPKYSWKTPLRRQMKRAGLYKRHPLELEPIAGFVKHLKKTLKIKRFKQEVENVARFLYFIDRKKPSLQFVYHIEKTNDYFNTLLEVGNTHQTVCNYLKNLKRFLDYILKATSLFSKDNKTYNAAGIFLNQLEVIQKRLRKGMSKEYVIKKEKRFSEQVKSLDELQSVLTVAEPSFKRALQMAENDEILHDSDRLLILNYLQSVVILKKFQRPGVIEHMMVDEWKKRCTYEENYIGIAVQEHKTGTSQIAVLILSKEEERWFEIYYDKIRPAFLKHDKEISNFFISSSGAKIYNVSNDIARFHTKFGLKSVTSQDIRRSAETFVASNCKDSSDKDLFAKYLAHSNSTAERIYREKTMNNMVKASLMTSRLVNDSLEEPLTSKAAMEEKQQLKEQNTKQSSVPIMRCKEEAFNTFLCTHPLSLEKEPPLLNECLAESPVHGQYVYDKWRKRQNKMRVDYVIGLFPKQKPDAEEVKKCISHQLWKNNLPRVKDICENWTKRCV